MTEKTEPVFSSSEDCRNMQQNSDGNPLAITSLVISIIAVAITVGGSTLNEALSSQKVPSGNYEPGDPTIVADKIGNAVTFLEQVFVFVVSNAISLTLSATAATIGLIALRGSGSTPAMIGIVLSTISILWVFR